MTTSKLGFDLDDRKHLPMLFNCKRSEEPKRKQKANMGTKCKADTEVLLLFALEVTSSGEGIQLAEKKSHT